MQQENSHRGMLWHSATRVQRYTLAQCHYDIDTCIGIVPLEIFLEAGVGRVDNTLSRHRESLTMLKPNIITKVPLRKSLRKNRIIQVHGSKHLLLISTHIYVRL